MRNALAILLLLVAPLAIAQELEITDGGITIAATVTDSDIGITGPTEAKPAEEVTCRITGTPTIDLAKPLVDQIDWLVGSRRMTVSLCIPGQEAVQLDVRAEMVFGASGATLQPLVRFPVGEAGEYRVLVDWNPDPAQLVWHMLTVEDDENPQPGPGPEPGPLPQGERLALILWESSQPTVEQAATKEALRRFLASRPSGPMFRVLDPDQPSENPWAATIKAEVSNRSLSLPVLVACVLPQPTSAEVFFVGVEPLPATGAEAIAYVEEALTDE